MDDAYAFRRTIPRLVTRRASIGVVIITEAVRPGLLGEKWLSPAITPVGIPFSPAETTIATAASHPSGTAHTIASPPSGTPWVAPGWKRLSVLLPTRIGDEAGQ